MGTSQAAGAPTTKDWERLVPLALKSPIKNPTTITDTIISSTLSVLLPTGLITAPLFVVSYESIRFLLDYRRIGLEKAAENASIRIVSNYVVPSIAKGLWDAIEPSIDSDIANSQYSKLTEHALRKTVSSILTKGENALEKQND